MRPERGLACLRDGCSGRIRGRHDRRLGERFYEDDEHTCPTCGARYTIGVTDDYEDDCAAYLIPEGMEGLRRAGTVTEAVWTARDWLREREVTP